MIKELMSPFIKEILIRFEKEDFNYFLETEEVKVVFQKLLKYIDY